MTYERAYYHVLMLQLGLPRDFDAELDGMLAAEDPLSGLALALASCGGDRGRQLGVLKEYLLSADQERVDDQAVAGLVIDRFRTLYEEDTDRLAQILEWMDTAAMPSGWYPKGLWAQMESVRDYYDLASEGYLSEEAFMKSFLQLLYRKKRWDPYDPKTWSAAEDTPHTKI